MSLVNQIKAKAKQSKQMVVLPEGVLARAPRSLSLARPFGTFESSYSVV